MNPNTLYPLTARRGATITGEIDEGASVAAYRAVNSAAAAVGRVARAIVRRHRRNKSIRELSALSDHMLKDIGISRGEIRAAVDAIRDAPAAQPAGGPRLIAERSATATARQAPANGNADGIAA